MPSQVAPTPIRHAAATAQPTLVVRRSAVAAGPISRAVDKMAPTASDDRPTARARASM